MQATGEFDMTKYTTTSSWSLVFIILIILIKSDIAFAPINNNMHKQAEH
jgi:hypothetical protein